MLEVRDLETAYGRSQVLFGVSLEIAPSQVVSLLGRNGMGKTTTVRSIMGIAPARSGANHQHQKMMFAAIHSRTRTVYVRASAHVKTPVDSTRNVGFWATRACGLVRLPSTRGL